MMKASKRTGSIMAVLALGAALSMVAADADARAGRGGSFGSRGARTWSVPPATQMGPRATPLDRSIQRPGTPSPSTTSGIPGARTGGFFSRPGLLGGLAAGFLGAGLFGMLFGNGLFGGLGGLASMLGLFLQLAIVFFVVRWLIGIWQRRSQPAYAGGPVPSGPQGQARDPLRQAPASVPPSGSPRAPAPASGYSGGIPGAIPPAADPVDRLFDPGRDQVGLQQADLDSFERLLRGIQLAYGSQDTVSLRALVTPEVLSFMEEDLRADEQAGVVNKIADVRLLDGDLSEAWREGDTDFATVAMRYGLDDIVVSRSTGEEVERGPAEVTEYWTFVREPREDWRLSAVQPGN